MMHIFYYQPITSICFP